MKSIDIKKVKVKNLIGIIEEPSYEDLLFEIVSFLDAENATDGEFKIRDVSFKTRVRISSELIHDIEELINLGYIEKLKYSNYRVVQHPWEKE